MENLLDQALELGNQSWPLRGRVLLIKDCVETGGAFLLHHLIKRALSSNVVIFISFSHPFSHYDRVLRKLGCNLPVQRDNNRFFFFDMLMLQCPDGDEAKSTKAGLIALYAKIRKTISSLPADCATIMVDDISLMEAAANGSSNDVLDLLHYCHILTSQFGCSIVVLNHEGIYSETERPTLDLQVEYLADVVINAEPLATGLATDVHGQDLVHDGLLAIQRRMRSVSLKGEKVDDDKVLVVPAMTVPSVDDARYRFTIWPIGFSPLSVSVRWRFASSCRRLGTS